MRLRGVVAAGWLIAVSIAVGACALPGRDNPNDPAVAPVVALRMLDLGGPGTVCPPPAPASGEVVIFASRGDCLELDASGTRDPGGRALRYVYSVVDTAGATVLALGSSSDPTATLALSPAVVRALPVGAAHPTSFRVRATSSRGTAATQISFVVLDGAPVALPPPPISLPLGGPPGVGTNAVVAFAGGFRDPDGDTTMRYCWSFPPELPASAPCAIVPTADGLCSTAASDPCFTRTVDLGRRGRVAARLVVVDDAGARSQPAPALVRVGAPNVWTTIQPPASSAMVRFDELRETVPYGNSLAVVDREAPAVPALVTTRLLGGEQLHVSPWPDFPPIPTGEYVSNEAVLAADSAHARVWAFSASLSGSQLDGYVVADDAQSLGNHVSASLPPFSATLAGLPRNSLVAFDADGDVWATTGLSTAIARVALDGTVLPAYDDALPVTGLSARPGSDEVWALRSPDFTNGQSGTPALVDYGVQSSAGRFTLAGESGAAGFAWIDHDQAWLSTTTDGLVRVDVSAMEAGASFQDAILDRFPEAFDTATLATFATLVVDPHSGDCWVPASYALQRTWRASIDGSLDTTNYYTEPLFVDRDGAIWFLGNGQFQRGAGLAQDGQRVESQVVEVGGVGYDPLSGGLWTFTPSPRALVRIAEDGRVVRTISSIDFQPGGVVPATRPPTSAGCRWTTTPRRPPIRPTRSRAGARRARWSTP